jgi:trigger factor
MATITRENIGLLNDKITVTVAKEDYLGSFEKSLKNYSKNANIPGFRKGMVPTGMIRKMHGPAVFTDEVLRTVEKELNLYMQAENLEIFAQPLPMSENDARQIDMNNPAAYTFNFEIGLKPEFSLTDLSAAALPFYKVTVTDEMVNEEVSRLQLRHGKMTHPDITTGDDNVLNVTFTECDASGNATEGGVVKDNSLLIKYFKESFRPQLLNKKAEDSFIIQPAQAFDAKELEWVLQDLGFDKHDKEAAARYFNMVITKVGLVEKAEMTEELFKAAFPTRTIADADEFAAAVKDDIQAYWDKQANNHLQHELYHVLLDKTNIAFPETFLKRWLQMGGETPKSPETVEQEFPTFLNQLKWTLITDKVVRENKVEVNPDDLKAFAKQQLFGYMGGMGMQGLDEEQSWITEYVNRMMQDRKFVEDAYHRIQTEKVFEWAQTQVKASDKPVTVEEFTKELEKHQHHHH